MPTSNPIQQLNVGEALGGASGAGVMQTDANGLILDPSKVALSSLSNLADQGVLGRGADGAGPVELLSPSANGQILKRNGNVVGFSDLQTSDVPNNTITLPKLAHLANATVIGRNTAGTGDAESVTMAQLVELFESALEANQLDWTVLQSFLAGMRLTPGAALVSPAEGTMWYELIGGRLMFRDPTGSIPLMEVGTWTPSLRADTVGSSNIVYSSQVGTYLKIGRRLFVDFNIVTTTLDLTGASGTMRIIGLPYTMSTLASQIAGFSIPLFGLSLATTAGLQMPFVMSVVNSTQLVFRRVVTGANTTTGLLAVGTNNGFLSGQNVTLQGSGYIGRTNEA